MEVRDARKEDVRQILKLLKSSKELRASADASFDDYYVAAHLSNPVHDMVVCVEKDKVVGAILADIWEEEDSACITSIVVDSKCRRSGIGSKMYESFKKKCKKRGLKKINMFVRINNAAMQGWSEGKGFKRGQALYYYEKKI